MGRLRKKIAAGSDDGHVAGRGLVEKPFVAEEGKTYKAKPKKKPAKRKVASAAVGTIYRDVFLGDAPAGSPCMGEFRPESWEERVRVNVTKFPLVAFALRVRGHSMTGRKIKDGDILIFALPDQREPAAGDVVAACIDGEVTIKTLVKTNGKSTLRSENPDYPNPTVTKNSAVQGVMLGKYTGKISQAKPLTPHVARRPSKAK